MHLTASQPICILHNKQAGTLNVDHVNLTYQHNVAVVVMNLIQQLLVVHDCSLFIFPTAGSGSCLGASSGGREFDCFLHDLVCHAHQFVTKVQVVVHVLNMP